MIKNRQSQVWVMAGCPADKLYCTILTHSKKKKNTFPSELLDYNWLSHVAENDRTRENCKLTAILPCTLQRPSIMGLRIRVMHDGLQEVYLPCSLHTDPLLQNKSHTLHTFTTQRYLESLQYSNNTLYTQKTKYD